MFTGAAHREHHCEERRKKAFDREALRGKLRKLKYGSFLLRNALLIDQFNCGREVSVISQKAKVNFLLIFDLLNDKLLNSICCIRS